LYVAAKHFGHFFADQTGCVARPAAGGNTDRISAWAIGRNPGRSEREQ
jgi:hypothetical protein